MKAYILTIDNPTSRDYAAVCAKSCDDVGLDWEYFEGFQNMRGVHAWAQTGIKLTKNEGKPFNWPKKVDNPPVLKSTNAPEKAECCTAGHAAIWKKIAEGDDEVAVILEHDSIMLHPINIKIPDNRIVVLGYKTKDPKRYDHVKAGPPTGFKDIYGHEGAHAYAITKTTAQSMIKEIETKGRLGCVDNAYFIGHQRKTKIPLCIMDPTPAIGWLRKSTIWQTSADINYKFIDSFNKNYK